MIDAVLTQVKSTMRLFAENVLLNTGWARNVLVNVGDNGYIVDINTDVSPRPVDAQALRGPVLPGMPNLHSHAFQRAFAGYSERRGPGNDSFWTWRKVMYEFVSTITPDQVQSIAEQLYVEMLKAGYTAVGEFHYLHHNRDGKPYDTLTEMSDRIIAAAETTGIAITHLPVLYAYGGFGQQEPLVHQRRFLNGTEQYALLLEELFARYRGRNNIRIGIAPHSLRAVSLELLGQAVTTINGLDPSAPVHIHIAEQIKEVDDCLAWCGMRPVAWLLDNAEVDERWCLIHATHLAEEETSRLAKSGAVVGLCPSTEANLGDGIFPAATHLEMGGEFGIGSDSHISVSPIEELRLLEYGQRLVHHGRAQLTAEHAPSVGANLYSKALQGGAKALGWRTGSLGIGRRADLLVLDPDTPSLINKPGDLTLDAMVFAGNINPVKDVMVGGEWKVIDGKHEREDAILDRFKAVQMQVQI